MHWGEVSQTLAQESFVQTITVKHLVSFAKGFLKCIFDKLLFNVKTCSMCAKLSFYVRPMFKQDRIVFIVDILLLSEIIQYVEGCGTICLTTVSQIQIHPSLFSSVVLGLGF